MIDFGVLCTYKKYGGWSRCKIRKIEGYGAIGSTMLDDLCHGMLVSLVNDGKLEYLFIADKPLLDNNPTSEDMYLLHNGIFDDKRAQGRCWFVNKEDEKDGIIYTSSGGMFHVKHQIGGVLV